ncbi:MAG: GNAT family N-acetyltransferase [Elstera sp.]
MLRPACASDADALTGLMKESSAYSGVYAALLDGYRITAQQITRDHFRVAEAEGRLLGFYSLALGNEPELDLLFVADAAQGLGIGRVLMLDLIEAARLKGFLAIKIVSHPPSLGFYLRQGAVQVGIKPASGRASWERPVLMLPISPAV